MTDATKDGTPSIVHCALHCSSTIIHIHFMILFVSFSSSVSEFDRRHVITCVACNLRVRSGDVTNSLIGSDLVYPVLNVYGCVRTVRSHPNLELGSMYSRSTAHILMIISDITATWWHHLVFKYHPIETTRFFIIWLEVNGTPPRCPCIGTVHQVSAMLRISEPYLQLCHLMQNTAVAAQITRTLQHMMGNLHSPELMVYCLLCVLLSDNILVPFSYEETVKLCKCKMFLVAELLFKVCNPSILSSSSSQDPLTSSQLTMSLQWSWHERADPIASRADASSFRIRNPIMQIKWPTTRPMNGPLSQWFTLHLTFHPLGHCCDSHAGGDMSPVTMWCCNGAHNILSKGKMTLQK